MRFLTLPISTVLLLTLAACTDRASSPTENPEPEPAPKPMEVVGLYQIEVSGIGTPQASSSVAPLDNGPSQAMTATGAGLVFEQVGASSFTEGPRNQGGQRYVNFTYRIRNGTGVSLNNLTLLLVARTGTIPGTAISSLRRFDGSTADPAIASQVIPTGAVAMGGDVVTMQALYPDVIQVLSEAEVAAITKPADVSEIFPVGYMVRSRTSVANRTLPATADANQFDGVLTVSFRLPLQSSSSQDVFSIIFQILALTDSETRLTESIEEGQDSAAVRRLRERASSLGATTVTVLNGSSAMDPAVADYPGQRQICYARTAGTAASPGAYITRAAAYSRIALLYPGESMDGCAAYFRTGTPGRPATNVPFNVLLAAVDRYGNVISSAVDTVGLAQASGPPVTLASPQPLVGGYRMLQATYSDYGTSLLGGDGRRNEGWRDLLVAGVTRNWTAGAGTTDWHTGGNWSPAAVPMSQDSVYVPAAAPLDPVLAANVSVQGVTVEEVATISLNAFDLTAGGNVSAGLSGGITSTTGRLFLAGTAKTVQGRLPRLRVTGTYSLSANVTAVAPLQVDAGRITASAFRLQAEN